MKIFLIYLLLMNIAGFAAMGIDKCKAKAHAWRIPEKTLFGLSLLGGSAGTWAGMYAFRHKTKHWYFVKEMCIRDSHSTHKGCPAYQMQVHRLVADAFHWSVYLPLL